MRPKVEFELSQRHATSVSPKSLDQIVVLDIQFFKLNDISSVARVKQILVEENKKVDIVLINNSKVYLHAKIILHNTYIMIYFFLIYL